MLPKVTIYGDPELASRYIPFARKELARYIKNIGRNFKRKYRINGRVVVIFEVNGKYEHIHIRAEGASGYEFITSHRYEKYLDVFNGVPSVFYERHDHQVTTLKKVGDTFSPRNHRFRKIKEANEAFSADKPTLASVGKAFDIDKGYQQNSIDWFYVPGGGNYDNGYSARKMTLVEKRWPRYMDEFNRFNGFGFSIIGGNDGVVLRSGGKPSSFDLAITSDNGARGLSTMAVIGAFTIIASPVGWDYKFAVIHSSGATLVVQADIPEWVSENVLSFWHFSPDGTKAISVQYNSDYEDVTEGNPAEYFMGISELRFTPAFIDGSLQCEVETLRTIYSEDLFVVGVDYDLFDSNVIRVLQMKHYHSPAYYSDPYDEYALLNMLEWSLIEGEVIQPAYRKQVAHHSCGFAFNNDSSSYVRSSRIDPNEAWAASAGFKLIEGRITFDLRRDAWALATHIQSNDDEYFYRNEYGIDGVVHESWWQDQVAYPNAEVVLSSDIPTGYTLLDKASPHWQDAVRKSADGETNTNSSLLSRMDRVMFKDANIGAGFRLSPNKSFALYWFCARFFVDDQSRYTSRPGTEPEFGGPPSMNFDVIKLWASGENGSGYVFETTHLEMHNSERSADLQFDPETKNNDLLAPHGVWII